MTNKTPVERDYSRIDRYYDKNGLINLARISFNSPCPICDTVINEMINKPIGEYMKNRRNNGEEHPWVCEICVQKIITIE